MCVAGRRSDLKCESVKDLADSAAMADFCRFQVRSVPCSGSDGDRLPQSRWSRKLGMRMSIVPVSSSSSINSDDRVKLYWRVLERASFAKVTCCPERRLYCGRSERNNSTLNLSKDSEGDANERHFQMPCHGSGQTTSHRTGCVKQCRLVAESAELEDAASESSMHFSNGR